MIKKIINQSKSKENKQLLSNFFSLSILQGANYLLPLLTFPYLVRVIGVEYFGLLAFATATVTYFQIITDYGFNLSATKEISIHRDNKEKLIEIFSSVMTIKFLLMFISFFLLSIMIFVFEKFNKEALVYFFTFGTVIGQVLFPLWFFQGIEKMKYITYLNIISKAIFTISIFIFIKEESDYYLVPILTSIGFILVGVYSLIILKKEFNITFRFQSSITIKYYLTEGWHIFLSRIYVNLYTTTNLILLGLFTNNTIVGYYSIAEKIVFAIGGLFEPATQTLYPYLVRKSRESIHQFKKMLINIASIYLIISFSLTFISEYFKEEIVHLITGEYNPEVISLLAIFLIRLVTYPFGGLFSNSLIIMNKKKDFLKVMNYTVLINFLIIPVSIYFWSENGLIISFIFVHIIHVSLLFYFMQRKTNEL
ncbi:putative flippase [Arcobacter acticola]|uniref:Putative flippase n=1 Tax=Arcobacter acticola TaxID=1849015 RepID=A0A6M8EHL8_9BACT|nr:flippase [Arcobacter acticola]QKE29652.1 putative flippase [Arcobacter acticola]